MGSNDVGGSWRAHGSHGGAADGRGASRTDDDPAEPYDSEFPPTMPPPLDGEADIYEPGGGVHAPTSDPVLAPLGVRAVRASVIDLETMASESTWRISEHGGLDDLDERRPDSPFPTAMATIVKLNATPPEATVTRRLDPRRWAFAWRLDGRRVAVVEASYRQPHTEQDDADTERLRAICAARFAAEADSAAARRQPTIPPPPFRAGVPASPAAAQSSMAEIDPRIELPARPVVGRDYERAAARASAWGEMPSRPPSAATRDPLPPGGGGGGSAGAARNGTQVGMLTLLLVGLGAALLFLVALWQSESLQVQSARLKAQSDSTMQSRMGETLAGGDYGEVQAELDSFASLGYFDTALVTNHRRRVVASVGKVPGVRIGDAPPVAALTGARIIDLGSAGSPSEGQMALWGPPEALSSTVSSQRRIAVGGLAVSLAGVCAAVVLLVRSRRLRPPPRRA